MKEEWAEIYNKYMKHRKFYNSKMAKTYNGSELIWKDGVDRAKNIPAGPDHTVLDIGSGPGILAIPLAKKCKAVTCIEPSQPMIELLKENIEKEKLRNIDIIKSKWETAQNVGRFDFVIASYSLLVPDIFEAFEKMISASRCKIIIYWFQGDTSWDKLNKVLFPLVFGKEYFPLPKADHLVNVLRSLDLEPEEEVLTGVNFPREYGSIQAAKEDLKMRVGYEGEDKDDIFTEAIRKYYEFVDNKVIWQDDTTYVKIDVDV